MMWNFTFILFLLILQSCSIVDQFASTSSAQNSSSFSKISVGMNKSSSSLYLGSLSSLKAFSSINYSSSSIELMSSTIQKSSTSSLIFTCDFDCNSVVREDLSLENFDIYTNDASGRWVLDADIANSNTSGGTTEIFDEAGMPEYYPACNVYGLDCNPKQNGYLYGRIEIKDYAQGTTGWEKFAGAGLILEPTLTSYVQPGPSSGIAPIGIWRGNRISIDMDVNIVGGSAKSGNNQIKIRLGEASYDCVQDGSCMYIKLSPKKGRARYDINVSSIKKASWIYTDSAMKAKGRNQDKYGDVYSIEIRNDAEPQTNINDTCTPSTAIFKVYGILID